MTTFVGIDISKKNFTTATPLAKGYQINTFDNNPIGIRKFIKILNKDKHHCIIEATGNYCVMLLYILTEKGFKASLVNPKSTHQFFKMMLQTTKTDKKDACLLSLYGEKMNPEVYKMPNKTIILVKQKRTVLKQLKKQLSASKNLYQSLEILPKIDKKSLSSLNKTISFLENQIADLEKDILNISNKEYQKQMELLTSIKGIGTTIASIIIMATNGFSLFENAKQFSRYIGLCPTYFQSGTSLNFGGGINRNGDSYLRGLLYIASWTAITHNAACKEFYDRLKAKGKASKVALIAVANKLIRQMFAVIKSGVPYINGYVSEYKIA